MDEFEVIRRYFAPLAASAGAHGLRDDVAEIAPGLIASKDVIVEGVHFLLTDPIDTVARKLVRANVSDIVAKGARPDAALLGLVWPRLRPVTQIEEFARALGEDLAQWGAHLVGGDTTSTDGPLVLSLTLLGKARARGPVRRAGAAPGDDLWVSGTIGDGWLGLQMAKGAIGELTADDQAHLIARYRVPEPPKLAFADLVAEVASASIDVSDGLVADAGHMAAASHVGIVIHASDVPFGPVALRVLEHARCDLGSLLTGGDDYQTLFTAPQARRGAIAVSGHDLTRIGHVQGGEGVRVLSEAGEALTLEHAGWRHFSSQHRE